MDDLREKVARAIATTYSTKPWECVCTSRKGLDCDCGDAMLEERCDRYDEDMSREDCYQGANTILAAIEASGHRIVPVEPTEEMVEAGQEIRDDDYDGKWAVNIYRAMLTAYGQKGE